MISRMVFSLMAARASAPAGRGKFLGFGVFLGGSAGSCVPPAGAFAGAPVCAAAIATHNKLIAPKIPIRFIAPTFPSRFVSQAPAF